MTRQTKRKRSMTKHVPAPARSTLHELTQGRHRRFEDNREKRGKQRRRREIDHELD